MSERLPQIAIYDGVGLLRATVTAAAATDILTATAHGFSVGDKVQFTNSGGALPAGLTDTASYYVSAVLSANTFQVSAAKGGATLDITGAGTGTHTVHLRGREQYVVGFRHLFLHMDTAGTATFTAKIQGSYQETMPDFNAAQSKTNQWDYIEVKDLEDGSAIDGDVGLAPAGADDNRVFEINTNGLTWVNVVLTAWTQGTLSAKLSALEQ